MDLYKEEVIDPGDWASKYAKEVNRDSYQNCDALVVVPHRPGHFRGAVGHIWKRHILEMLQRVSLKSDETVSDWVMLEEEENDGAGGKPQFFTLVGTEDVFFDAGWETIVMCADDFARTGRFPAYMVNELNAKRITKENLPLVQAFFRGYGNALAKARLANTTGETAVMKRSITAFCDTGDPNEFIFTHGGSCHGLSYKPFLLNPEKVDPGMPIVGLHESGYRCNGGGWFVDLLLELVKGDIQALKNDPKLMAFVRKLCYPSVSYSRFMCDMIGWCSDGSIGEPKARIVSAAHITGGGVWEKLKDALPQGIGAVLDKMPNPPEVLLEAQAMSEGTSVELSDEKGYGTLHGGCGMMVVCASAWDAMALIAESGKYGIQASEIGVTVSDPDQMISITSRFNRKKGEVLYSPSLK